MDLQILSFVDMSENGVLEKKLLRALQKTVLGSLMEIEFDWVLVSSLPKIAKSPIAG